MFHIDFGHFMNHKKDKFGIKRERTPFVLTKDFIRIVTKGDQKVTNSEEFDKYVFSLFLIFHSFVNTISQKLKKMDCD